MELVRSKVKTNGKALVYTIENFLTEKECDDIIKYIDSHSSRSKVSGGKHKEKAGVSNVRTSYTSSLHRKNIPIIETVDKRMSRAINVPLELGEVTQGQKYNVGQEFKDHLDFFGKAAMKGHGDKWGNRTWTFMIYLNDVEEGGETDFPKLKMNFKPRKGLAVIWQNMTDDGEKNYNTLHAGRPVKSGTKYIITKWFRQKPTGAYPISSFFKNNYPHLLSDKKVSEKSFHSHKDFPKFTKDGFKKIKVPDEIWNYILKTYDSLKSKKRVEKFPNQLKVIYNQDKTESPVDILSLAHKPDAKKWLHDKIQPILEEWSGQKIEPTMIYGIRSYKKGAILAEHVDRIRTHHISAIIIVDRKGGSPWALDIRDHSGKMHKVYGEPGEMILYESCACKHGRLDEFDGEYFRNFFVHYKLTDWEYLGNEEK